MFADSLASFCVTEGVMAIFICANVFFTQNFVVFLRLAVLFFCDAVPTHDLLSDLVQSRSRTQQVTVSDNGGLLVWRRDRERQKCSYWQELHHVGLVCKTNVLF